LKKADNAAGRPVLKDETAFGVGAEERRREMSEVEKALDNIEMENADDARSGRRKRPEGDEAPPRRIVVDKRTHRVRLENETESEVTVVIEERGGKG
jgi:hypothetical protein